MFSFQRGREREGGEIEREGGGRKGGREEGGEGGGREREKRELLWHADLEAHGMK